MIAQKGQPGWSVRHQIKCQVDYQCLPWQNSFRDRWWLYQLEHLQRNMGEEVTGFVRRDFFNADLPVAFQRAAYMDVLWLTLRA